ncbi:hypothetical protein [Hominenteromicrobium sp.]|uniref:hypothetical protein n=1 Tax=Hominenteromicrobium sp. TaxID=3073581 RepID=UPI0039936203
MRQEDEAGGPQDTGKAQEPEGSAEKAGSKKDKYQKAQANVMYDIPGVVFDQPLNIPAAFLCIGVWAAASAVLANVALVRRK